MTINTTRDRLMAANYYTQTYDRVFDVTSNVQFLGINKIVGKSRMQNLRLPLNVRSFLTRL